MGAAEQVCREGACESLRRQIASKCYTHLLDLTAPGAALKRPPLASEGGDAMPTMYLGQPTGAAMPLMWAPCRVHQAPPLGL